MCRSVWGRVILRSICEPGKRESGSLVSWHTVGEGESRELVPRYRPVVRLWRELLPGEAKHLQMLGGRIRIRERKTGDDAA